MPQVDPDEARRAADDILSGAAYAEPTQSLLDRAFDWLFERLGSALGTLSGGGPGTGIAWVFVVGLLALATWFVFRALRAQGFRRPDVGSEVRYGTETSRDADVWLAEAARLAVAGDREGALRCRHQALVAALVTQGLVADVVGRTAGEYASAAVESLPEETATIRRLTDRFDRVWYGGERVDAAGYAQFEADCVSVETAAAMVPA